MSGLFVICSAIDVMQLAASCFIGESRNTKTKGSRASLFGQYWNKTEIDRRALLTDAIEQSSWDFGNSGWITFAVSVGYFSQNDWSVSEL